MDNEIPIQEISIFEAVETYPEGQYFEIVEPQSIEEVK